MLLLALSFGAGSFAHAMETQEIAGVTSMHDAEVGAGQPAGGSDHAPGSVEKGFAHHHGGCHADHVAAPFKGARTDRMVIADAALFARADAARPDATADPALRPPQA